MKLFGKVVVGVLGLGILLAGARVLKAGEGMKAPPMPAEFEKLKSLVGNWKCTGEMNGKPGEMKISFELTSGGTALLERIGAGTPGEMVSIYHAEGGKVVMTHYCSMGNQPKMRLLKSSKKEMDFAMRDTSGIGSASEPHMHAMNLVWKDANHVAEEWTMYGGGKKQPACTFTLTRQK